MIKMAIDRKAMQLYQQSLLNGSGRGGIITDTYEEDLNVMSDIIRPLSPQEHTRFAERLTPKEYTIDAIEQANEDIVFDQTIIDAIEGSAMTFSSMSEIVGEINNVFSSTNIYYEDDNKSGMDWIEDAMMNSITKKSNLQYGLEGIANGIASFIELIPAVTGAILTAISGVMNIVSGAASVVGGAAGWVAGGIKGLFKGEGLSGFSKESYDSGADAASSFMDGITDLVEVGGKMVQQGIENYSQWLANTVRTVIGGSYADTYQDGVSETKFGQKQEDSWRTFVSNNNNSKVRFIQDTPVSDWGTDPILFGAPPRYTHLSDPRDRAYMNTFIKDGSIMSILPGKPKYNGLNLSNERRVGQLQRDVNLSKIGMGSKLQDALDANEFQAVDMSAVEYSDIALDYLKRNGISDIFNKNDKRYYTFEPDLASYYSYLETILNTIYTRMGLGENQYGTNDLFTFFDNTGSEQETLSSKYNGKAIGFYFEGNPSVSESAHNSVNDPAGLKSTADALSDEFQRMNYTSGFGKNSTRNAGVFITKLTGALRQGRSAFDAKDGGVLSTINEISGNKLSSVGNVIKGIDSGLNLMKFTSENDLNAMTQSLMTTNGMKTAFPNLWTDSGYSKSVTVDFEFVSPYGDPLSIFQHVYVPLAALLALALPKQAAENGYVNPFFLRMDIPGVISSDFSIISSIQWVRGGRHNIWTTDRHPRAITVSVTFEDLYNYMAMTRRVSYLSANPNYSMFLDSFSGIRSLYNEGRTINNDYWTLLVNRLNSNLTFAGNLWNANSVDKSINTYLTNSTVDKNSFFTNYYKRDLSWMKSK